MYVFGRFATGTLVNPKEHASFIIMDGDPFSLLHKVEVNIPKNVRRISVSTDSSYYSPNDNKMTI
jgi:hypothetical protein